MKIYFGFENKQFVNISKTKEKKVVEGNKRNQNIHNIERC